MKITDIEISQHFSSTNDTYTAEIKLAGNLSDILEILQTMTINQPPELSDEDE